MEYKYVIVRESDGQAIMWEPFDGNRTLDIVKVKEATVEDLFGQKIHVREKVETWPTPTSTALTASTLQAISQT
jgi:hypothetical protein